MKITKQWALKKYIGITEDEIIQNAKMWKKAIKLKKVK